MKITLALFLSLISGLAFSQADNKTINGKPGPPTSIRICAPSRSQLIKGETPLFVVFSHNETFYKSDSILQVISPQSIKSINVLKDSISLKTYGPLAKFGVVEIYIDDVKHPEVYKKLKP